MRQFKIRNLLVQVLPLTTQDALRELVADGGCESACSLNITDYTKGCCAGGCSELPSGTCTPCSNITNVKYGTFRPADLILLKAQLELALREIEVREKVVEEQLSIHTLEEASMLEEKLAEALDQVRALKANMPTGESE